MPVRFRERRFFQHKVAAPQTRGSSDASGRRIMGRAIVYDQESEVLGGWFVEVIRPGAVTDALKTSDVRCLFNHDANLVLGRTKSGTLTLRDSPVALEYDCLAPDTQVASDLIALLDRGDVDQSSFAFTIAEDRWTFSNDPNTPTFREILKIEELYDVSPVTYPAYPTTEAYARCAADNQAVLVAARARYGQPTGYVGDMARELALLEHEIELDS